MKHVLSTLALAASMALAATVADAATTTYRATLSGPSESPPNTSPGTGLAIIDVDDTALTMHVRISFSGLVAGTTASHIHCCTDMALAGTAAVATMLPSFTGFPLGVTSGLYEHDFDMSDPAFFNPAFLNANGGTPATATTALLNGLSAEEAYANIHTTRYPAGEIRGFLINPIPEPSSWAMLAIGLAGVGFCYRRKA
jgi:hypothetical protein